MWLSPFPATSLSGGDIDKGNQLWTDTDIALTHTRNISKPFNTSSFLGAFTSSGLSWSPWPCHMSVSCWHFIPELWQELWICAILFYDDDLSFVLKSWLEASSKIRASQCKSLKKHVLGDSPALKRSQTKGGRMNRNTEMWIQYPLYPEEKDQGREQQCSSPLVPACHVHMLLTASPVHVTLSRGCERAGTFLPDHSSAQETHLCLPHWVLQLHCSHVNPASSC